MAEPRDEDEHTGSQDPTTPLSPTPSPGPGRAILHAEDITARKRPRLSPRASPGHPRGTESPWAAGGGGGWRGPRAGRVTGLYAQLLRELEAEVGELQRALAARDEAVLHRDRRIRQLELENRQLRSHVRSLEEENDLLSSGDGHGGPLATTATATRTPLASGTGCIGVSDSNVQFLKALVELLEGDAAAQVGWGAPALLCPQPRGAGLCPGQRPAEPPGLAAAGRAAQWLPPLPGQRGGGRQPSFAHRHHLPLGGEPGGRAARWHPALGIPHRGEREAQTGAGPQLGGLHHPPAAGRPRAGPHRQAQAHDPAPARLLLLAGDAGPVLSHGAAHRPQQHHHGAAPPPARGRGQRHQRVRHQDVRPRLQLQRRHQQQVRHVPAGRQEDGREDGVS